MIPLHYGFHSSCSIFSGIIYEMSIPSERIFSSILQSWWKFPINFFHGNPFRLNVNRFAYDENEIHSSFENHSIFLFLSGRLRDWFKNFQPKNFGRMVFPSYRCDVGFRPDNRSRNVIRRLPGYPLLLPEGPGWVSWRNSYFYKATFTWTVNSWRKFLFGMYSRWKPSENDSVEVFYCVWNYVFFEWIFNTVENVRLCEVR